MSAASVRLRARFQLVGWDGYVPLRGKWARRALLLPFVSALWAFHGIRPHRQLVVFR